MSLEEQNRLARKWADDTDSDELFALKFVSETALSIQAGKRAVEALKSALQQRDGFFAWKGDGRARNQTPLGYIENWWCHLTRKGRKTIFKGISENDVIDGLIAAKAFDPVGMDEFTRARYVPSAGKSVRLLSLKMRALSVSEDGAAPLARAPLQKSIDAGLAFHQALARRIAYEFHRTGDKPGTKQEIFERLRTLAETHPLELKASAPTVLSYRAFKTAWWESIEYGRPMLKGRGTPVRGPEGEA